MGAVVLFGLILIGAGADTISVGRIVAGLLAAIVGFVLMFGGYVVGMAMGEKRREKCKR